jgi:gamma-glutamyltranspeptidase/glutathione hydrolase
MYAKQHRGVVVAQNGLVAASQPLAVSTGLSVLQRGGSFADAAIATSAVLCVTEPYNSHLGGDAFLIVYDAATGQTTALNGSGAAPRAASLERFPEGIPLRGLAAASVPGLVDTWFTLHARWGTLPISELLAPAIVYAEEGFPAGWRYAQMFAACEDLFAQFPATKQALLGEAQPLPGARIRQPDLAWTLRQIAEGGRDAFYAGPVADRILRFSRENNGLFAAEDLAAHQTQVSDPLRTTYRGYTVHGQPPVSQGHILLQELNLVEGFDLAAMGHNSADAIHAQVEAKKLAFADRAAYLGDPKFVRVPMETLLSKAYAAERRRRMDPQRAAIAVPAGEIEHDTTYFCVADAQGSAVSFIQSVFYGFGCGVVAAGTGVLFNNRMTGFSLDPASPNVLAPGKRTAHTLNAYLITRDPAHLSQENRAAAGQESAAETANQPYAPGNLAWVGGTPGGDIQVQSNLQVICNVIDFGLNPQEAVEAARWQHHADQEGEAGGQLGIEERLTPETRAELARRGHRLAGLGPWGHGSAYQLIAIHPETRAYLAGSDPRCDGQAAGF